MEQREQRRHHIGTAELYDIIALLSIRNDILVREFNALRSAFGTRTEKDNGIVAKPCSSEPQPAKEPTRARHDNRSRKHLANRGNLGLFFIQVEHLAFFCNLHEGGILATQFIEKGTRRHDCIHVRLGDAPENSIDRGGIVQVHARLACTENGDNPEGGIPARGYHEADIFFVLRNGTDYTPEITAKANHAITVHVVARRVNENRTETALAHRLEPERDNRFGMVYCDIPYVRAQEMQFSPDGFLRRVRRQNLAVADAYHAVKGLRAVHAFRSLAVAAPPQPLNIERDNRSIRAFDGLRVI